MAGGVSTNTGTKGVATLLAVAYLGWTVSLIYSHNNSDVLVDDQSRLVHDRLDGNISKPSLAKTGTLN